MHCTCVPSDWYIYRRNTYKIPECTFQEVNRRILRSHSIIILEGIGSSCLLQLHAISSVVFLNFKHFYAVCFGIVVFHSSGMFSPVSLIICVHLMTECLLLPQCLNFIYSLTSNALWHSPLIQNIYVSLQYTVNKSSVEDDSGLVEV
jgi:hypothetical protein